MMVDFSDREIAGFLKRFLAEIEAGNAAIFAGAGLSAPAGFVNWKELLREIAHDLDLVIDREDDLISVAQWHVNKAQSRYRLNKEIIDHLSPDTPPTANHRLLARMPIATWWTTNYDTLAEEALKAAGKVVDVKSDHRQLADTKARRDTILYKMHGDVSRPNEAVVTRDDYESYARDRAPFVSALAGDLVSKTFLFIGFSFTDPNLEQVLARVRLSLRDNTREHFAFFKRRQRGDADTDESYAHDLARQKHIVADLKRYGVNAILVDDYADIDEILQELERRYRRQSVFVAASADDFGPWGQPAVEKFMRALGSALVGRRIRIVTGLGLGVGNALFTGAIERVLESRAGHIEDSLIIRPFPQHILDPDERQRVWAEYRLRILSEAGVALFLFGNKRIGDAVVPADGIEKEWEIACEKGLALLPIAATGSMARTLAEQAASEPDVYLTALDDAERGLLWEIPDNVDDLMLLVEPIANLIARLRRGR
ncbi:SIR2 family protein [Sphingomonas sp. 22176]|uniref:SIR2 family protein n=1 Tax=Sphingomonas sp. 22176 TaxID=3453884 RepID=UPI003F855A16